MAESSYGIGHFDYQQIPSLYSWLQLCFLCWPDHDHTYNVANGRILKDTSLLRNGFWFLEPEETFIFTSKTSTSVIGLGHWFESERSVPANKDPYSLAKGRENRCRKEWGTKLPTPDAVLLAPKHVPSPERNSLNNGCCNSVNHDSEQAEFSSEQAQVNCICYKTAANWLERAIY